MTSVLNVDTIADKAGTGPVALTKQSAAKAWLKVDQSSTQSILDSFNVASITDLAVSETNLTFSNSMNNTNYSVSGSASVDTNYRQHQFSDVTSSTLTVHNSPDASQSFADGILGTSVHGDLA